MIKRVVRARELGVPIIMHNYLTGGFTSNTSLAHYYRDNALLLHIHRAIHVVIDRQKNHGMHFRVLAKALRMSGGDHIHAGTVVGKLKGERDITLGFVNLLRDDFIEKDSKPWYLFHSRLGFYARCSARSFGGYSRLAYACFDRDLWR
ncbi:hypothetical protein Godav_025560 [Gossypium davidsonii]|uniref:Ribulose bisphosphate carboxylase large subunit C-terminal domain-containing protein n=1 Tax=Gossypium davidsonii TaxID=34287 RepID=A0A7J8TBB3_GOSDV|nr:hypothetical protein [Gossypium davidsonii]